MTQTIYCDKIVTMLFSKPSNHKVLLLLDVQSSLVRGTLVNVPENELPSIVFSSSINIPYHSHGDTTRLIKLTLKAIEDSIYAANDFLHTKNKPLSNLPKKISEIHYVLASPWVVSRAKTVHAKFTQPTTITKSVVLNLVHSERQKDIPKDIKDIDVIEEKIFDVRLNGYAISEWEGKSTKEVSVTFATTIAGAVIIERLKKMTHHIIAKNSVFIHSNLLLQYLGIQALHPGHSDFVLIHVHGELTDMVVVNHGIAVYFGSIARGVNTVIRSLGRTLDMPPSSAESLMNLKESNSLQNDPGIKEKIEKNIELWSKDLSETLQKTFSATLPKKTYITARSHEKTFKDAYKTIHPHAVELGLEPGDYTNHVSFTGAVPFMPNTALYIVALIYIGRIK